MFKYLLSRIVNYLLSLLNKDKLQEPVKDVNQEVYQEIKETPSLLGKTQVEVDTMLSTIVNPDTVKPMSNQFSYLSIKKQLLPPNQYVQDSKFKINQIVIHHTNGRDWESTYNYWNSNSDRICTHFLIDRDGSVIQCIPLDKAWGFHINVSAKDNKIPIKYKNLGRKYDMQSVGIELCSMSQVTPYKEQFIDTYGKVFKGPVTKLDKLFRGFQYFETYTEKQIKALELLLLDLLEQYPVLKEGVYENYEDKFDINFDALEMKPGIYFHVNYRTGTKWDCYPHPELIKMLNELHNKI